MKNQESKRNVLFKALALVIAICTTNSINATSWRIGSSTYKPHFTSIADAMSSDNVQDGDTLYLDSGLSLSSSTVTKAVTIVGTGYFMSGYAQGESTISGLTLNAENIKVMGCKIVGNVYFSMPNVCLERCYVNGCINMNNKENSIIRDCYIFFIINSINDTAVPGILLRNGNNSIIENNIVFLQFGASYNGTVNSSVAGNFADCIIRNNYIGRIDLGTVYIDRHTGSVIYNCTNCEITNNIFINNKYDNTINSFSNCTFYHNLLSSSSNSLYPYNRYNLSSSSIFASGSNDKAYMLSASSPAKGYATDGGDCGPYGGSNPYVASGLPFGHPYHVRMNITLPEIDGILKVSSDTRIQNQ